MSSAGMPKKTTTKQPSFHHFPFEWQRSFPEGLSSFISNDCFYENRKPLCHFRRLSTEMSMTSVSLLQSHNITHMSMRDSFVCWPVKSGGLGQRVETKPRYNNVFSPYLFHHLLLYIYLQKKKCELSRQTLLTLLQKFKLI